MAIPIFMNPFGSNDNAAISTDLNNNSWKTIREVSDAGKAPQYWKIGDRKAVTFEGKTIGAVTLNGTYYCYIIGFDHNQDREGINKIHFQFGYTQSVSGSNIAYVDTAGNVGSSVAFRMNTTDANAGGWNNSLMRNTICDTFKSALPIELQNVLKDVTKYTDNVGGSGGAASNVTATTDTIFIPSEYEVAGVRSYANAAEQNYQKQYKYYADGNSKIKNSHKAVSSAVYWWTRSPRPAGSASTFSCVSTNGGITSVAANTSQGFAPCFCV